mgnify:FL=1
MESYKPRKNSEISLYPIELMLKKMQDENKCNLKNTVYKTSAVSLSGVGIVFLFQNMYLKNMVEEVVTYLKWNCTSWKVDVLTFLFGFFLFAIINVMFWGILKIKNNYEDSKRNKELREDMAEYFHKVILNNIIMGLSFAKKASNLLKEKAAQNQCCFYASQSLFYLKTAIRELDEKRIFEAGGRERYTNFVNEVGWITLFESLKTLDSAFLEIDTIIQTLSNDPAYNLEEGIFELNELKRQKSSIENARTITLWKTQLIDTLNKMNKKKMEDMQ